jgi:hypothetical protein
MSTSTAVGGGGLFGGQVGVDLGVRDLDLAVDFVLAQALHDDLVADLSRKAAKVVPSFSIWLRMSCTSSSGLRRCGRWRGRAAVVDAHAHFLGQLQLGALDDHALRPPGAQVGRIGQLGVLGRMRCGDRRRGCDFARVMTSSLTTTVRSNR